MKLEDAVKLRPLIASNDGQAVAEAVPGMSRLNFPSSFLSGERPLDFAINAGADQAVRALLAAGVNPIGRGAHAPHPLETAIFAGYEKVLEVLLAEGDWAAEVLASAAETSLIQQWPEALEKLLDGLSPEYLSDDFWQFAKKVGCPTCRQVVKDYRRDVADKLEALTEKAVPHSSDQNDSDVSVAEPAVRGGYGWEDNEFLVVKADPASVARLAASLTQKQVVDPAEQLSAMEHQGFLVARHPSSGWTHVIPTSPSGIADLVELAQPLAEAGGCRTVWALFEETSATVALTRYSTDGQLIKDRLERQLELLPLLDSGKTPDEELEKRFADEGLDLHNPPLAEHLVEQLAKQEKFSPSWYLNYGEDFATKILDQTNGGPKAEPSEAYLVL